MPAGVSRTPVPLYIYTAPRTKEKLAPTTINIIQKSIPEQFTHLADVNQATPAIYKMQTLYKLVQKIIKVVEKSKCKQ